MHTLKVVQTRRFSLACLPPMATLPSVRVERAEPRGQLSPSSSHRCLSRHREESRSRDSRARRESAPGVWRRRRRLRRQQRLRSLGLRRNDKAIHGHRSVPGAQTDGAEAALDAGDAAVGRAAACRTAMLLCRYRISTTGFVLQSGLTAVQSRGGGVHSTRKTGPLEPREGDSRRKEMVR
jgi:hypothetical protein